MITEEKDQLEERLADPLDELEWVARLERRGQGDQGEDGERIGTPHRPDGAGDEDEHPRDVDALGLEDEPDDRPAVDERG
jgi:hypothetical protein